MNLGELLKKTIPCLYRKYITWKIYIYNFNRFKKYSGAYKDSKVKDCAYLTWLCHVIEKGLAMPKMRYGFGHDKILELDKCISKFIYKYGDNNQQVNDAISVILEYDRVHVKSNWMLSNDVQEVLNKYKQNYPNIKPVDQLEYTKSNYFSRIDLNFPSFMRSRHSVRNFSGEVCMEDIKKAIELAHYAPSACNRQPARVHIIANPEIKDACLSLQNGNRGFGHLGDKLLIVTGDLRSVLGVQEFFDLGTNIGIFLMNLSYSLHYCKIAHCILNWYVNPLQDKKIRELVNIPNEETIFAFIICGGLPDKFKVVTSPRVPSDLYYTIHK